MLALSIIGSGGGYDRLEPPRRDGVPRPVTSISRAVYGARSASPAPVSAPDCLSVPSEPLSAPRGARRALAPAAETAFGVRSRGRDPRAALVREAGPFPPE